MNKSRVSQSAEFYDLEAKTYDDSRYSSKEGQRRDKFHKSVLGAFLATCRGSTERVLELGCGTGRLTVEMAAHAESVVGVDISRNMLDCAKDRLLTSGMHNVSLVSGDVSRLPFPNESFGSVYAILVLNLFPDIEAVFSEVARVLKPGGIFVFNLPNLSSVYFPGGIYVNLRGRTVTRNRSGFRYSHWYSYDEVQKLLLKTGFSLESVVGQPPSVFLDKVDFSGSSRILRAISKSLYFRAIRR